MEKMVTDSNFWKGKKVLVTGHTGFKGGWLTLWLNSIGAEVVGFSLPTPTTPSFFEVAGVEKATAASVISDIRNPLEILEVLKKYNPEIIFHMAAQSLVRHSYSNPVETYATNVMGTVHLLDAVRRTDSVRVVVNITTDKCYENREWLWGYRENDSLGGYDPYSSSKACSELVTSAYRNSFFNASRQRKVSISSVRAGNVFGGGDWSSDRLIPDIIRAVTTNQPIIIRNPNAIRPWQHVLEPLNGYLNLAEKQWQSGSEFAEAWNFGPNYEDAKPVSWIVEQLTELWGNGAGWKKDMANHPHEANYLKLDCSKVKSKLGWIPKLPLNEGLSWTIDWYRRHFHKEDMKAYSLLQIKKYQQIKNNDVMNLEVS